MSESTAKRLREKIDKIAAQLGELILTLKVTTYEPRPGVLYVGAKHSFAHLSPQQQNTQLLMKRQYERWLERVRILLANAPRRLEYEIEKADNACRRWIELSENWSVRPDPDHNVSCLRADFGQAAALLEVLGEDDDRLFLVPDTNSLLANADPTSYRQAVGRDEFVFLLTPTVLRELDQLKVLHRNPDVREKAQKAITRIKGWRKQGNLLDGVTCDHTIHVVAVAEEPQVATTLSWLDPTN